MSKRGLFIASTTAGLAAFGAIAFMQLNPRSFTNEPRVDLDSYLYSEVPHEAAERYGQTSFFMAESRSENAVVLLPVVYVVGEVPRVATPQALPVIEPEVVPAKPMEACSPWRDMGPTNVDEGVPSGTVRVRDLC